MVRKAYFLISPLLLDLYCMFQFNCSGTESLSLQWHYRLVGLKAPGIIVSVKWFEKGLEIGTCQLQKLRSSLLMFSIRDDLRMCCCMCTYIYPHIHKHVFMNCTLKVYITEILNMAPNPEGIFIPCDVDYELFLDVCRVNNLLTSVGVELLHFCKDFSKLSSLVSSLFDRGFSYAKDRLNRLLQEWILFLMMLDNRNAFLQNAFKFKNALWAP